MTKLLLYDITDLESLSLLLLISVVLFTPFILFTDLLFWDPTCILFVS